MAQRKEEIEITEDFMSIQEPLVPLPGMEEDAILADEMEGQLFEEITPIGDYSKEALNVLTRGINKVLKFFPGIDDVEGFDQPIEDGPIPESVTRPLSMIMAAASDYGWDDVFALGDLEDDRSLKEAAGKLDALSKDNAFRAYLAKPQPDTLVVEEEVEVSVPAQVSPRPMVEEVDEEELILSRMS